MCVLDGVKFYYYLSISAQYYKINKQKRIKRKKKWKINVIYRWKVISLWHRNPLRDRRYIRVAITLSGGNAEANGMFRSKMAVTRRDAWGWTENRWRRWTACRCRARPRAAPRSWAWRRPPPRPRPRPRPPRPPRPPTQVDPVTDD